MTDTPHVPAATVPLPGGGQMPLLGFGTWQIKGEEAVAATRTALEAGYRHLDTATVYGNEAEVGRGLRESGVAREEVFLTTKCPPHQAGRERETLEQSLEMLGTDRVDLWLLHWPAGGGADTALWEALVEVRRQGLASDVGVSNFDGALLDQVTSATGVAPAVNQVEWSPLLFDRSVLEDHRRRGVVLEGYSALRGGTLEHPVVARVAEEAGRTPAQVLVRWHLQHGVVVIPKSVRAERIRANADVDDFDLTAGQMDALDALGAAG